LVAENYFLFILNIYYAAPLPLPPGAVALSPLATTGGGFKIFGTFVHPMFKGQYGLQRVKLLYNYE
jgi:hypothetical protein